MGAGQIQDAEIQTPKRVPNPDCRTAEISSGRQAGPGQNGANRCVRIAVLR